MHAALDAPPASGLNVPASQGRHAAFPQLGWKVPAAQASTALPTQKEPGAAGQGDGVAVEEALAVARGVPVAEAVPVPAGLREEEALRVWVAEPVREPEALPVAEAVPEPAPLREPHAVDDAVGDDERVPEPVPEEVAVGDAVREPAEVALPDAVCEAVPVAAAVALGPAEADTEAVVEGGATYTRRMRLFPMSAMMMLLSAGLNAALRGQRNVAAVPSPSAEPSVRAALPATVVTTPKGVTRRKLLFPQSATSTLPPASTARELLLLKLKSAAVPAPSA
jgi:hypothetical protein